MERVELTTWLDAIPPDLVIHTLPDPTLPTRAVWDGSQGVAAGTTAGVAGPLLPASSQVDYVRITCTVNEVNLSRVQFALALTTISPTTLEHVLAGRRLWPDGVYYRGRAQLFHVYALGNWLTHRLDGENPDRPRYLALGLANLAAGPETVYWSVEYRTP